MIERRTKNYPERPEVIVGDIFELVACKMFSGKLLKLRGTHESVPTALELNVAAVFAK